nr:hypothetical protein [Tanacetum cinerariifolium]
MGFDLVRCYICLIPSEGAPQRVLDFEWRIPILTRLIGLAEIDLIMKRVEALEAWSTQSVDNKNGYNGKLPLCNSCKLHYTRPCTMKCNNCKRTGHQTRDYRTLTHATTHKPLVNNQRTSGTYFEYGLQGHYKSECPKLKNQNCRNPSKSGGARERAFVLSGGEVLQDPNVVTSMFLLNNLYAIVLIDLGDDRSFISTAFSSLINIAPTTLDVAYTIELANGKLIEADTIIQGCTLKLATPAEIQQFLGLAGYYQRFIEGFLKIAKPLTKLTQKNVKFEWEEKVKPALLFPRVGSTTLNDKVIVTLSSLKCKLLQQGHLSNSAVGTLLH